MNHSPKRRSRTHGIPNLSELTEQIEHGFFEAMRRPPREGDRLFYWSYCYSDAEVRMLMIANMLRANNLFDDHAEYSFIAKYFGGFEMGHISILFRNSAHNHGQLSAGRL